MHRVLRRQLRRALQIESNEEVDRLIDDLRAKRSVAALDQEQLQSALLRFVDAVGDSYAQLERDLELRTRSLDISSAELFAANRKLQLEADTQEAARSFSDQRLRLALDASGFSLWDWEFGQPNMYFDARFGVLIGEAAQAGQRSLADLAHRSVPEDAKRLEDAIRDVVLARKSNFAVELRLQHRAGHWIWVQTFGSVTRRAANGHALRLTGTVADITSRKSLEATLADNLQLLETVLEAIPLPVMIRDRDLRVRRINAACESMFGVERFNVLGKSLDLLHTPQDPSDAQPYSDQSVLQGGVATHYESQISGRAGQTYDVMVAKAPVTRADGSVDGIVSILTDITQHKRAAEELERQRQAAEAATRAKSRFLANMSHELRTPLNGVVGMASLLEATALEQRQQHYVQTLRTSAEALIGIINDILDIAKIEAGKLELTRSHIDLREQLEQVVSLFSARAMAKNIELAAHIAPRTPQTFATDPIRLRQVLGNLVSNAVKFTERGEVLVSARSVRDADGADWLRFEVADTGIGIATDKQSQVFDAFVQVDDSSTRRFGGTGLGLTICRDLVSLLGGSLGLKSTAGVGSCFYFQLPLQNAGKQDVADSAASNPPRRALVISPNKLVSAAIAETLGAAAEPGTIVADLVAAIDGLAKLPADAGPLEVVVDAGNTGAPSDELLAALRLASGDRAVRITLLTQRSASSPQHDDVDRVIYKPFCTTALTLETKPRDTDHRFENPTARPTNKIGKVLLVEDNEINRELACAMLDRLGVDWVVTCNGREGVDALGAHPDVDLILMDCQMPVMDGYAATRAIRSGKLTANIPIIALTGNAMQGDREACEAAGMNDYLTKPFDLATLRAKLFAWLPNDERANATQQEVHR